MTIIAFVRRKKTFAHEKVATYIKSIKPKNLAIFLLVNEEAGGTNFSFVGIFPDAFKYKCDWGAICKSTNQDDFTSTTRGTKVSKKITNYTADKVTLIP